MPRRSIVYAVAAGIVVAAVFGVMRPALSVVAPVRIMPLGDSITAGPGCWRALLWDRLQRTGFTTIDFVGTQSGGGCSVPLDPDHEGHAGMSATGIASQNLLPGWLSATNPNIVLMHLGTNDMWGNFIPTSSIIAAYSTLVDQMRANNPSMKIVVAQIIPMNPSSCPECAQEVVALNAAIPAWAAGKTTAQSPIVVVDQWTGFDAATNTTDGVHPNASGEQKMSDRWYPKLIPFLSGATASPTAAVTTPATPPTTPPRTVPPTTPPSTTAPATTPPPAGGCSVAYTVTSQWPGAFQGSVKITNSGATAVNGWSLKWTFATGQVISQLWNGSVTQTGATVTVTNASYNAALAANGGTADVGFLASWNNSTNAKPTSFTLNNTGCTAT